MDPLTQGVVGAVAAQQAVKHKHVIAATCLGFLSAMTPDLDVLIQSNTDPLLALEYHRQFTHSVIFIPIGGLICALFFYYLFAKRSGISFRLTYLYCFLGYASHGLIDACTTYGTLLFWPFSDMRIAWNTVSIIDPLFTLPLLIMIVFAACKRNKLIMRCAFIWLLGYMMVGVVQRERAESAGEALAKTRGHSPLDLKAKPSFANLLVWKTIYTDGETYYVDAVRVGLKNKIYEGASVDKLQLKKSFEWLEPNSQQAIDVERFRWFSNGYLALSPTFPNRIIDMRYSMLPNNISGLWGIELDSEAEKNEHVKYVVNRNRDNNDLAKLWSMIKGE